MKAAFGALIAAGALAIAVPAIAHTKHSHSTTSKKCTAHKVAYIAAGTVDTWSATEDPTTHKWSGDITVKVKSENHHVKGQKGSVAMVTLNNTKVRLGKSVPNPPVAGDRADILGKVTEVRKSCSDQSAAGTVTVREVDVSKPKHTKS